MHHSQNAQLALAEIDAAIKTGALSAHEILNELTGALDPWTLTTSWKFVKMSTRLDSPTKKGENRKRINRGTKGE